jgi:phosphoribosylanthranilate isomerase
MIIKVCGLTLKSQIEELDDFKSIQWLGTIFYSKSKRYINRVNGNIKNAKKVGVFVNQNEDEIENMASENELDIVQLHGNETPEVCLKLKNNYILVKAFGIDESFDFQTLIKYINAVDYFLFDTKTMEYGGSGQTFDWSLLDKYKLEVPFIISGGINKNSVLAIQQISHPSFAGIDLNSGFENKPGDKNCEEIKTFIKELKNE